MIRTNLNNHYPQNIEIFDAIIQQFKKLEPQTIQIYINALIQIKSQLQSKTQSNITIYQSVSKQQQLHPTRDYNKTSQSPLNYSLNNKNNIISLQKDNEKNQINKKPLISLINQQNISLTYKLQNISKILNSSLKTQELYKIQQQSRKSLIGFKPNKYLFIQNKYTGLFQMDLISSSSINTSIDNNYFEKLKSLNRFLVYKINIGQSIKVQNLFQYLNIQWLSLRQLILKQDWTNKYYSQCGLQFINQINIKLLKILVLQGNQLTQPIIQSLKKIQLLSLQTLELQFFASINPIKLKQIINTINKYNNKFKIKLFVSQNFNYQQYLSLQTQIKNKISFINENKNQYFPHQLNILAPNIQKKQIDLIQKISSNIATQTSQLQIFKNPFKPIINKSSLSLNKQISQSRNPQIIQKKNKQQQKESGLSNLRQKKDGISTITNFKDSPLSLDGVLVGNAVVGHNGDNVHHHKTQVHNHHTYTVIQKEKKDVNQWQKQYNNYNDKQQRDYSGHNNFYKHNNKQNNSMEYRNNNRDQYRGNNNREQYRGNRNNNKYNYQQQQQYRFNNKKQYNNDKNNNYKKKYKYKSQADQVYQQEVLPWLRSNDD